MFIRSVHSTIQLHGSNGQDSRSRRESSALRALLDADPKGNPNYPSMTCRIYAARRTSIWRFKHQLQVWNYHLGHLGNPVTFNSFPKKLRTSRIENQFNSNEHYEFITFCVCITQPSIWHFPSRYVQQSTKRNLLRLDSN